MTFPHENPWVFERDEIDLLEEEIDELYRIHEPTPSRPFRMETRILQEQLETEEQAESELAWKIGQENLLHEISVDSGADVFIDGSVKEILRAHSYRDPLYERVFLWAQLVSEFSFHFYQLNNSRSEDAFRAFVNAKLIPTKLALTRVERSDEIFRQIIQKERKLCLAYFLQIFQALQNLSDFSNEKEWQILLQEGMKLQKLVENERI